MVGDSEAMTKAAHVTVVTSDTSAGDVAAWVNANGSTVYAGASSNEQILQTLERHVASTGKKISTLDLSGHGWGSHGGYDLRGTPGLERIRLPTNR